MAELDDTARLLSELAHAHRVTRPSPPDYIQIVDATAVAERMSPKIESLGLGELLSRLRSDGCFTSVQEEGGRWKVHLSDEGIRQGSARREVRRG